MKMSQFITASLGSSPSLDDRILFEADPRTNQRKRLDDVVLTKAIGNTNHWQ